ncbi:MAG TPA: roadblock/LC7 domain-containing protein [Caldisericia bacterium]|nr:roadblock/LC7 domain-containing protein [Caldisericia bacterium]HOL82480.1 roadblock/LC7 domain-containing protein [Caldisericia bacterium]HPC56694.1 roadblock/LC7 domain-containing protein [Caldisericia bacterium]HPP43385.1 roadblock/LC7 domain-containing protein [Caldisericia bacterium]HRT36845.1 roadblock/LC7 domain-containing protein [Caldisericia bacterium]
MIQDVNLIKEKFNKLMENDKTVESLILISKDGLPISSTLSMEEEEKIAALSASLVMLGERAIEDFKKGEFEEIFARGNEGYIFIYNISQNIALLGILTNEAKLGLIRLEFKNLVNDLKQIVGNF